MSRWLVVSGAVLWGATVLGGFGVLNVYASTPGAAGAAPDAWPEQAGAPDATRPTLVFFAHPGCPCTLASTEELHRLATHCVGKLAIRAWVYADPEWGPEELESQVYHRLVEVTGAEVAVDRGGEMARRFGARTSGQALLYAADGRLLFSGGITPSRGCQGDNTGRLAIERLVRGQVGPLSAPVYGCSLTGVGP